MPCVTTFPPWGWDVYARRCLTTWVKAWPDSILAYYEGDAPPAEVPGTEFRPLESKSRTEFLSINTGHAPNFLYDVKRFCHKVFAQLLAMEEYDQFYWLDSDIEMMSDVPKEVTHEVMNKSFVSFLGRNTYTECGLIAFNQLHPDFPAFKERYESCYTGDFNIFKLPYWTDCHAFDYARQGEGYNLTPYGRGVENILPRSVFGQYMFHHKGRLKLNLEEQ